MSDETPQAALKRYFHFDDFLENQRDIVTRINSGENLIVVMPTGAGKSLCYQLPILMSGGYGIVISPLISLMKDQVDALRERRIAAEFINSSVAIPDQMAILDRVERGEVKLLYVAPERFGMGAFQRMLSRTPPAMLIVDEAHCISQWGHDFRPAYLRIGEAIERFNIGQICAFTATATQLVREDIRKQLHCENMQFHVAGFKRPNLAFSVISTSRAEDKFRVIGEMLKEKVPTIIYTSTRKAVEQLAEKFDLIAYHAGMSDEERNIAQERFMHDPSPVLAATNAFGMGIDRPDVRRVIHYNLTGTVEAYYQEAGRAGRDGEPAECILLFSFSDKFIHEFLIDMNNPTEQLIRSLYDTLLAEADERNSPVLEMTLSELAEVTPGAKNDTQISSAMSILEQNGYVIRQYRTQNRGSLVFRGDLAELKMRNGGEDTQRSRFVNRMIGRYAEALSSPLAISVEEMAAVAGLNAEQVKRVLRALSGEVLNWTPPFGGRATEIADMTRRTLEIDFAAIAAKREFELERLNEMIAYTRCRSCRQSFLIGYFGEDAKDWSCGNCDHCAEDSADGRELSAGEFKAVRGILAAVAAVNGRLGAGKLCLMLTGSSNASLPEYLRRHALFGALKHCKQHQLQTLIGELVRQEVLTRSGGEYPTLRPTELAAAVLRGEVTLSIRSGNK